MTIPLLFLNFGNSSKIEAITASQSPQTDEIAKRQSIKKNMKEKNGLTAIALTACFEIVDELFSTKKNVIHRQF